MSSLTPAQRRVLEAAQRGKLEGWVTSDVLRSADEISNGGRRSATLTAKWLVAAGLLEVDGRPLRTGSHCHALHLTAAGRSELGITETEKD